MVETISKSAGSDSDEMCLRASTLPDARRFRDRIGEDKGIEANNFGELLMERLGKQ